MTPCSAPRVAACLVLLLTCSVGAPHRLCAQEGVPRVEWARMLGGTTEERGLAVRELADGGFAVCGLKYVAVGSPDGDALLLRVDAQGEVVFERLYGSSRFDEAKDLEVLDDGGFVLAGATGGTLPCGLDCAAWSLSDLYVVRTDASGALLWERRVGGSGADAAFGVDSTGEGEIVAAGMTRSFGDGATDVYVVKLSASGEVEWERAYGGTDIDEAYAVVGTPEGGAVVAGETRSFGQGGADLLILRVDGDGELLWRRTFGSVGAGNEGALGLTRTRDGGYVAVGHDRHPDVYLVKVDEEGELVWECSVPRPLRENGYSIREVVDGGLLVAGLSSDGTLRNTYVVKTSAAGDLEWDFVHDGPGGDWALSLDITSDGGFVTSGRAESAEFPPDFQQSVVDVYLVKFAPIALGPPRFLRGDVTADGSLSVTDGVFLAEHLFQRGPAPPCRDAADVDDSGTLTIADVVLLVRVLFAGAPPPAPPYPDLGTDPSPDGLGCAGTTDGSP